MNYDLWSGPPGRPKTPVRCIETGEEFSSITECATHFNGTQSGLSDQLNGRRKSYLGFTFERIIEAR